MPTVIYTPEELIALEAQRRVLNARGAKLGCHACPVCLDSQLWKPFHDVEHWSGKVVHGHGAFHGTYAHSALCEDCWGKASIEERIQHHKARHEPRRSTIKSVQPMVGDDDDLIPDPADKARRDAEILAHESEWQAIENAIRKGVA